MHKFAFNIESNRKISAHVSPLIKSCILSTQSQFKGTMVGKVALSKRLSFYEKFSIHTLCLVHRLAHVTKFITDFLHNFIAVSVFQNILCFLCLPGWEKLLYTTVWYEKGGKHLIVC